MYSKVIGNVSYLVLHSTMEGIIFVPRETTIVILLIVLITKNNKMKQVVNINLGSKTITIHVDAYNYLCSYLDSIEKPIKNKEVAERVLSDYESKMAKLWTDENELHTIITIDDVRTAIDTLGSPEIPISALYGDKKVFEKRSKKSLKRRLYRDREHKIVAGVASGVAAYLGMNDPIWVRIGFVVAAMAGFASVPVYLVLWMVMPYANTQDELWNGEKLDLSNTVDRMTLQLDNLSQGIRNKFGSRTSF